VINIESEKERENEREREVKEIVTFYLSVSKNEWYITNGNKKEKFVFFPSPNNILSYTYRGILKKQLS
jgi:hypothetical protein